MSSVLLWKFQHIITKAQEQIFLVILNNALLSFYKICKTYIYL